MPHGGALQETPASSHGAGHIPQLILNVYLETRVLS